MLMDYNKHMSTLAEIETAIDGLPVNQKQELMLFLATRLRAGRSEMPPLRQFTMAQMQSWIAEDEAEMEDFRCGA